MRFKLIDVNCNLEFLFILPRKYSFKKSITPMSEIKIINSDLAGRREFRSPKWNLLVCNQNAALSFVTWYVYEATWRTKLVRRPINSQKFIFIVSTNIVFPHPSSGWLQTMIYFFRHVWDVPQQVLQYVHSLNLRKTPTSFYIG